MSETALIRDEVLEYCKGKGVDIGCGGDKICQEVWGFDRPVDRAHVGDDAIEIMGNAFLKLPFSDNALDYIYSSHCLEDCHPCEIIGVLMDWLRCIKQGGYLMLYLPDEAIYKAHCIESGQVYNQAHQIHNMSLDFMKHIFSDKIAGVELIKEIERHAIYSFLVVIRKL